MKHSPKQTSKRRTAKPTAKDKLAPESFEEELAPGQNSRLDVTSLVITGLKGLLWLIIWGITVELGFGAIYLIASLLVFIYLNTGTKRDLSEPSAYSVFNEKCERIPGTFTAEKFGVVTETFANKIYTKPAY